MGDWTGEAAGAVTGMFDGGGVTLTPQQIYENFQHGEGSAGLSHASGEVNGMIGEYEDLGKEIEAVMKGMEPAWQGEAGNAATHGAGPMAVEFVQAQDPLNKAQDLVGRQGTLFDSTKHSVVPVPPAPDAPSGWDMILEGGSQVVTGEDTEAFQDYETKLGNHQDAAKHNVDQMNNYSTGSDYNTVNLPDSYGTMLATESAVHVDQDDGGGDDTGGGGETGSSGWNHHGYVYNGGGGSAGGGGTSGGGATSGGGSAGVQPPPDVPGGHTGTTTTGASAAPGYGGTAPGTAPGQAAAASQNGFGPMGSGGSQQGYGAGGGGVYGGSAGTGAYGGSGAGSGGSGGGTGARGGSAGSGGQGGKSTGPKAGSESGAAKRAPGASAAEEAAGRSAPKSGSGRGMGAMPRGGGKGGGGDEDYEHERPSWLVEPDPDDFWFGGMGPVAPPVLE